MDLLSQIRANPSPTLLQHLSRRMNRPVIGGTDTVLMTSGFDQREVWDAANRLLAAGMQLPHNLDAFVDCFTDDVRYVTTDNKLWSGKAAVRAGLEKQMAIVPFMRYGPIEYFEISGNRLTIYTWNRAGPLGFPNITVFYYAGGGKWFLVEDFFDTFNAGVICQRFVWSTQGIWAYCKFIFKALFY